jgi:endonuclease/exonuclease/phosphatase family metal-dependent hydrolase
VDVMPFLTLTHLLHQRRGPISFFIPQYVQVVKKFSTTWGRPYLQFEGIEEVTKMSLKANVQSVYSPISQIRNKWLIQSMMILIVLTLLALGGLPVRGQVASALQGGGGGGLKVMTWNVKGGRCGTDRSMSPLAQVIRAHQPDVVAIQEVHRDQASRLAQATGLHSYFVGTLDCKDKGPDYGIAILSRTAFQEGSTKAYPFYDRNPFVNANHPADTARREFRKLAGVSIRVGGRLIRIYNTHLTGVGVSSAFFNYYRVRQVGRILAYIAEDQRNSAETFWPILMGDFNSQPNTLAYTLLLVPFKVANNHGNTTIGGTRVDYIFIGRRTGLTIDEAGVLATGSLSDHFPVVARLSFN